MADLLVQAVQDTAFYHTQAFQQKALELGLDGVRELAKQLITLATGILALSITFTKDIVKEPTRSTRRTLRAAWSLYLVSIVGGILTMMALTGTLMYKTIPVPAPDGPYMVGWNVRGPALFQIASFLVATLFISVYGWFSLRSPANQAGSRRRGTQARGA